MVIINQSGAPLPDIAELIPHRANMVMLDRVISVDAVSLCAEVTITSANPFYDDISKSVGAWVGIEMMAQTMAAFEGYQALQLNEPVKVGFLLGTRHYESHCDHFPLGCTLQIAVHQVIKHANGLGAFECKITEAHDLNNKIVAIATVTAFKPDNVTQFLQKTDNVTTV